MILSSVTKHELFEKIQILLKIIFIKSTLNDYSVLVNRTYNQICELDINDHNDQECTRFEPFLLSSAEEHKHSKITGRLLTYGGAVLCRKPVYDRYQVQSPVAVVDQAVLRIPWLSPKFAQIRTRMP